jgi:hypothetical protein
MTELDVRCVGCGDNEADSRLERCVQCGRYFCNDCAYRATGRRFCTQQCAHAYFWQAPDDDDDDDITHDN